MDETEDIVGADAEVTAEALAPIKQAYKLAKKTHDASGPEVTVTPAEEEVPGALLVVSLANGAMQCSTVACPDQHVGLHGQAMLRWALAHASSARR